IGRRVVDPPRTGLGIAHDGELRRQRHAVALAFEEAPNQLLIAAEAVSVRRIEEIDAEVERGGQCVEGLRFIGGSRQPGQAQEAESDGGNVAAAAAKRALLHHGSPSDWGSWATGVAVSALADNPASPTWPVLHGSPRGIRQCSTTARPI